MTPFHCKAEMEETQSENATMKGSRNDSLPWLSSGKQDKAQGVGLRPMETSDEDKGGLGKARGWGTPVSAELAKIAETERYSIAPFVPTTAFPSLLPSLAGSSVSGTSSASSAAAGVPAFPQVVVRDHAAESCISSVMEDDSIMLDAANRFTKKSRVEHSYSDNAMMPPPTSFGAPGPAPPAVPAPTGGLPPPPAATSSSHPYTNASRPFFPHKTMDVPKSALHAIYGKRQKSLAATNYITWNDAGPPHDLYWTSILVCPLTGELYLTKPWGKHYQHKQANPHDFVWYKKKTNAEHGAAALAHDCFTYREFHEMYKILEPFHMLLAENGCLPYLANQAVKEIPNQVPSAVRTKVKQLQQQVYAEIAAQTIRQHQKEQDDQEMGWSPHPGDGGSGGLFPNS